MKLLQLIKYDELIDSLTINRAGVHHVDRYSY
jgi:hypothetical protein